MDQEKIGRFIAACRKDKLLTQEQLAEKLGVSNKTVSRWENGNSFPDASMLKLLSNELGITVNELLIGEKAPADNERKQLEKDVLKIVAASSKHPLSIKIGDFGLPSMLTIVFVVLKLTKVINWSWIWILSPIWITILAGGVFVLVMMAICKKRWGIGFKKWLKNDKINIPFK